jgi:hypothetical protein
MDLSTFGAKPHCVGVANKWCSRECTKYALIIAVFNLFASINTHRFYVGTVEIQMRKVSEI